METLSSRYLPLSGKACAVTEMGARADEEGNEIHEVTGFADDASTADFGVLCPVIEGNVTCVDAVMDVFGFMEIRDERVE